MKNLFITLGLSIFCVLCKAQKKCLVIGEKAFAITEFVGMMQVDTEGNEVKQKPTYNRKIILTTTCKNRPFIKSILYNNTNIKNTIKMIDAKKLVMGLDTNGKEILIKCGKSNFLWEINVAEIDFEPNQIKSITVNGMVDKKPFILQLKEINIIPLVMPN